jgi:flagellar biosynthesis GTPase FlhF
MLDALLAAAAEAVFSYILETLEPAERLRDWLKRSPVKLAYQHALARTYTAFARQYPELTTSLFNESFLTIEAAPELAKFLTRHQHPDHTQLVRLWAKSITPQTEAGQRSVETLVKREDFNVASAYFVDLLTAELKHESALQPLFDSRALESLPVIESQLDALAVSLDNHFKQALAIANNYQQTVVNNYQQTITNRSGGVDFQTQEVTVGGDVVGRDKVVSNTYNNYFTDGFETLDDLYVRPDAVFQRVRVQDFVGREWLTAKVDNFLNDEKRKSGVFLLVGEAGVGKTSFMAHFVT